MDKNAKLKVNDHVIYFDEFRKPHNALVETWWLGVKKDGTSPETLAEFEAAHGEGTMPCCNLLFVEQDSNRTDQYGGQKQHKGSVVHGSRQTPPNLGYYYLFPDEVVK